MASTTSISEKQGKALLKLMEESLGDSLDAAVERLGQEDTFTLFGLRERLKRNYETEEED